MNKVKISKRHHKFSGNIERKESSSILLKHSLINQLTINFLKCFTKILSGLLHLMTIYRYFVNFTIWILFRIKLGRIDKLRFGVVYITLWFLRNTSEMSSDLLTCRSREIMEDNSTSTNPKNISESKPKYLYKVKDVIEVISIDNINILSFCNLLIIVFCFNLFFLKDSTILHHISIDWPSSCIRLEPKLRFYHNSIFNQIRKEFLLCWLIKQIDNLLYKRIITRIWCIPNQILISSDWTTNKYNILILIHQKSGRIIQKLHSTRAIHEWIEITKSAESDKHYDIRMGNSAFMSSSNNFRNVI